jgi:WD40 repeat protein
MRFRTVSTILWLGLISIGLGRAQELRKTRCAATARRLSIMRLPVRHAMTAIVVMVCAMGAAPCERMAVAPLREAAIAIRLMGISSTPGPSGSTDALRSFTRIADTTGTPDFVTLPDTGKAAFSPDGSRVVTTSNSRNIARIWDADTGKELVVLRGHLDVVWSAAFSPDGTRVVTGSRDKTARIWDAVAGQELNVLRGFEEGVYRTAFSPDGTRIMTDSEDKSLRIWNAVSGEQIAIVRHKFLLHAAAFSPDGARVLTASLNDYTVKEPDADYAAHIWDAVTGEEVGTLRGHKNDIWSAAFSPDGTRIVTASWDHTAGVWDAATGRQVAVLQHEENVNSAAFSRDGTRIVTASGKTARVWDAATGGQIAALRHESELGSAIFNPDATLVLTASKGGDAHVWNLSTGQEVSVLGSPLSGVESPEFSADGRRVLATLYFIHAARIWQRLPVLPAAIPPLAILKPGGGVGGAVSGAFSPDGTRVAAGSRGVPGSGMRRRGKR